MKMVRFKAPDGATHSGVINGDEEVVAFGDELVDMSHDGRRRALGRWSVDEVTLVAPVRPGSIIGIGLNYRDHARETGAEAPTEPVMFGKLPSCVTGPGSPIYIDSRLSEQVDYEAELGVVIGRACSDVAEQHALEHVLGYVCVNDVSARDLQVGGGAGQWLRGKSLDSFAPIGPHLVTADEVSDPQRLSVRCTVNDEVLQNSSTEHMIFSITELIAYISRGITLQPGDLILTGTPAGVGLAQVPPRWLTPGDEVAVEIGHVGRLVNPVRAREEALVSSL